MFRIANRFAKKGLLGFMTSTSGYIMYISKLPPEKKYNLVFDLDNTLIHAVSIDKLKDENLDNNYIIIDVDSTDNKVHKYAVKKRPFMIETLYILSLFNNIHLFTKAKQNYADKICEKIEIDKIFVSKYYRDSLKNNKKDIKIINSNLNKTILIDDKKSNNPNGQHLYHIPYFDHHIKYDFEFLKLLWYALKINIIGI